MYSLLAYTAPGFHECPLARDTSYLRYRFQMTVEVIQNRDVVIEQLFQLSRGYAVGGGKTQILFYHLVMVVKAT